MRFTTIEDGYFPGHLSGSIYAQYVHITAPDPCKKYHISSDIRSGQVIAETCLPILRAHEMAHKVVETLNSLIEQSRGKQVGKFITVYAPLTEARHHPVFAELSSALAALDAQGLARPAHSIPKYRPSHYVFHEAPIDHTFFIYGGFVCDPHA